jgi:hypothetical protein
MSDKGSTSFDLDVDDSDVKKPEPVKVGQVKSIRKVPPKPRIHKAVKVEKKAPEKKEPTLPPEPAVTTAPQEKPELEIKTVSKTTLPVSKVVQKETIPIVSHPQKSDINLPFDINVDPGAAAAVVGTIAVAAAGTAAATTGAAAPVISAVKAGIVKAKAALGISSKAAVAAGATVIGAAAVVALEKKFNDYEKDLQSAKEDVGGISDQLKKLDALLDNVKPKQ